MELIIQFALNFTKVIVKFKLCFFTQIVKSKNHAYPTSDVV